jgi:hypothetical protein
MQPIVVSASSVQWPAGHSEEKLAFGYVMVRARYLRLFVLPHMGTFTCTCTYTYTHAKTYAC